MTQKKRNEVKLANSSSSAPMIQKAKKKKSVANTKKANIFNQVIISNGEDATQKFNHISKGKNIVEPSNDNTDQMDVDLATAAHFQEELLMDILSRLPVRSLLQFKCVSKFWNTLISEPYFKMKHLNHAKNDQDSQKFLIAHRCPKDYIWSMYCVPLSSVQPVEDVQKFDCPSNPKPCRCAIHCCYDGLAVFEVPDNLDKKSSILLLWNPSTRESLLLPPLEFPPEGDSTFGLGYDSTSGEYKILHIRDGLGSCKLPSEILALKGGSWRSIDEHPRGICTVLLGMRSLPFVHEAFHWIAILKKLKCFVVVSFSISNEVYGEIPLPKEMLSLKGNTSIGVSVLEGMLCIYSNSTRQRNETFKLWVLKEYGVEESWTRLLTIEDPWICNVVPKYRFADGEVLFRCLLHQQSGNGFRTPSGPFVSWPRLDGIQNGYAFTESLISPKSLTY
ncbi:PREDICTED: F-box/kelch-repeat protein At3g23880-like [Nicotiana attenuata]|uniref:F-box/kelch-repeat protein At3g23880-like n=1 Tax=Nicotiana attenuata TaxID=49451 RepID=UPI0009047FA6|nr:PREDICTED: F-box/kelch-repeat protein At3g23880-like [Nicotiana attenuata]XP_019240964.1 PREDICTED: F-box/kelch-repeat protein At3g23880-like [Nicotiana attenuata]